MSNDANVSEVIRSTIGIYLDSENHTAKTLHILADILIRKLPHATYDEVLCAVAENNKDPYNAICFELLHSVLFSIGQILKLEKLFLVESKFFTYHLKKGYIILNGTDEVLNVPRLTQHWLSGEPIRNDDLVAWYRAEILRKNQLSHVNRFDGNVWSEIKGMFNWGVEGRINHRVATFDEELPRLQGAYTIPPMGLFSLPMNISEILYTKDCIVSSKTGDHLQLYFHAGLITVEQYHLAIQALEACIEYDLIDEGDDEMWRIHFYLPLKTAMNKRI